MPPGPVSRCGIGAKNARYTGAIASTRNSFFAREGMRASIAKDYGMTDSHLAILRPHPYEKKAARELIPRGLRKTVRAYCLLGLLAAGGFDPPCSPAFACETSNIRVPLSRCTFFPAEVITEPCVAFEPAAFRFKPFNPNAPWLFEVSCPAAFKPPTAPFEAPAMLPPAVAAEFKVPPAAPPVLAAVFVTAPTAPPAVDVTPPNAPRPPAVPEPAADAPMPPMVSMSAPAADAPLSAEAIAWIVTLFNGISCPFFRIALSNTMPSDDSDSPLARAEACVTWPTSFEPFGIAVFPSDFAASVVRAFTGSPGLHFFESIGELSAALNAVPLASEAFACLFCADAADAADADALPEACACVCPACTEACPLLCAPACAPVCDCAAALRQKRVPTAIAMPAHFMVLVPPQEL